MFIRVRDKDTRHEFDLPEGHAWIRNGLVEQVKPKQYPPAHVLRRPKHHLNFAVTPAATTAEPSGEAATTEKE
jgi:hypothetical protein